jgi:hypothetical protein
MMKPTSEHDAGVKIRIGVERGVSKRVEDWRRSPALQKVHP